MKQLARGGVRGLLPEHRKGAAGGHVGEASDVAQSYLYAIRQRYSTGQVIVVDGGATLV